jgi:transcriptional regulator with XRE-family HTH domain
VTASDASDTDPAVDAVLRIGDRVSSLREQRGLKISDLARRVSVSPSLISQIERGQSRPSVTTLFALARELGVPVDAFMQPSTASAGDSLTVGDTALDHATARELAESVWPGGRTSPVMGYLLKEGERPRVEIRGGVRWERLTRTTIPGIEFMELVYGPGAESDSQLYRHPGLECIVVTHGQLDITVGFDVYHVHAGDSMAFPSSLPHRYVNPTADESRAITVILRDDLSSMESVGGAPSEE